MTGYDCRAALHKLHYYEQELKDCKTYARLCQTWSLAIDELCKETEHSYRYNAFIHNRINRVYNARLPRFFAGADVKGLILHEWKYPRYL